MNAWKCHFYGYAFAVVLFILRFLILCTVIQKLSSFYMEYTTMEWIKLFCLMMIGKNLFNNVHYLDKRSLMSANNESSAADLCNLFSIFTFRLATQKVFTFKMWLLWSVAIQMYGVVWFVFIFICFIFWLVSMWFRHRTKHTHTQTLILFIRTGTIFSHSSHILCTLS